MNSAAANSRPALTLPSLLRSCPADIRTQLDSPLARSLLFHAAVIVTGAALYGAVMGWWRSPVMAAYNAVKFPAIILATFLGNALLNGILAPLLGLNLRFRDSLRLVLLSGSIATAILAGFAPLVAFAVWNTPPLLTDQPIPFNAYRSLQLLQVTIVGLAGITGTVRLHQALRSLSPSSAVAWRVLGAWLAGNLLFGSQLCWILRPLIGSPHLPIQFLRDDALKGSFFETTLRALLDLL